LNAGLARQTSAVQHLVGSVKHRLVRSVRVAVKQVRNTGYSLFVLTSISAVEGGPGANFREISFDENIFARNF
jgi:hypothetical protein